MKKLISIVFVALFALSTNASNASNSPVSNKPVVTSGVILPSENKEESKLSDEEAKRLVDRLKEIRKMDKKNMTVEQKHELRNEVSAIKEQLKKHDTVVYLSTAAIIIILLLVILL